MTLRRITLTAAFAACTVLVSTPSMAEKSSKSSASSSSNSTRSESRSESRSSDAGNRSEPKRRSEDSSSGESHREHPMSGDDRAGRGRGSDDAAEGLERTDLSRSGDDASRAPLSAEQRALLRQARVESIRLRTTGSADAQAALDAIRSQLAATGYTRLDRFGSSTPSASTSDGTTTTGDTAGAAPAAGR